MDDLTSEAGIPDSVPNGTEAVILCGGLGSRLGSLARDVPKSMLEIGERPFLTYLLDRLSECGVTEVTLAVSHLRHIIIDFIGSHYRDMNIHYSVETEPLGTGGAIRQAVGQILERDGARNVLVLNGDTWAGVDFANLVKHTQLNPVGLGMAVMWLNDTGRYGRVQLDEDGRRAIAFQEKQASSPGFINAGVYCIDRSFTRFWPESEVFSFEVDILQRYIEAWQPHAEKLSGQFIDIGLEQDLRYFQANHRSIMRA
ncbi:sugar phosphate nucleotidyltransferase [Parasalinivibrio latis]|uniref:sugar phosphate nucleotidyltransferase n=1 Tax=Parasalinivibrio latis TaxID=2952610 RepID=UPI0030DE35C9